MENKEAVCAVVVTYNRKELLIECLDALCKQTRLVDAMYIIDNFSNDGTAELLLNHGYLEQLPPENPTEPLEMQIDLHNKHKVHYVRMNTNTGGAGGFYEGMLRGIQQNYDWLWLMDDDVEPLEDSLEQLLLHKNIKDLGFLSSVVRNYDLTKSLNVPEVDVRPSENGYPTWEQFLKNGLVKIESATFVSFIVHKSTIEKIGYPIKEFFIWGDDTEYSKRITRIGKLNGYLVGKSTVLHKRHNEKNISILDETNSNRIKFHYYAYRNGLIIQYKYGSTKSIIIYCINSCITLFKVLPNFTKAYYLLKGIKDGFFSRKS